MTATTLRQNVMRLRAVLGQRPPADALAPLRADPASILTRAGLDADPWQAAVMRARTLRTLFLCSRQSGKSTTAAALALREALLASGSLILLLSPTLRQSGELYRKVLGLFNALGRPVQVARETALTLELANGSRIVSLPESESNIRGYSAVKLLVVDEAARVADDVYFAVRPMLAVSGGGLVMLSTAFGKRGVFYTEWESGSGWDRVRVTAEQCPRISPEFLAEERVALGSRWYRQEYECSFEDMIDAVFSQADIDAALANTVEPLTIGGDDE